MGVVQLGVVQLGVVQLGVVQMGIVQLGVVQVQLGSVQMGVVQIGVDPQVQVPPPSILKNIVNLAVERFKCFHNRRLSLHNLSLVSQ